MDEENNNNKKVPSGSNEDLSEYTDADESISAPTEFLAEFISALLLRDYHKAHTYCKLILQYEPNNTTAMEFHPLLLDKIGSSSIHSSPTDTGGEESEEDSDEGEEMGGDKSSRSDSLENDGDVDVDLWLGELEHITTSDKEDELVPSFELSLSDNSKPDSNMENEGLGNSKGSDGTTNSYSSLEDDEVIRDDNALEEIIVEDNYMENAIGTVGDNDDNGNVVTLTGYTQIVQSLDEDYNFNWFTKVKSKAEKSKTSLPCDPSAVSYQISSDSESPTDPITQQTIDMLRAKYVSATH